MLYDFLWGIFSRRGKKSFYDLYYNDDLSLAGNRGEL